MKAEQLRVFGDAGWFSASLGEDLRSKGQMTDEEYEQYCQGYEAYGNMMAFFCCDQQGGRSNEVYSDVWDTRLI